MRLDAYLAEYFPEYSRSTWQKYIKLGYVKVNDKVVKSGKYNLDEDDQVTYNIPELKAAEIDIPIIFQDENVLIINKPSGILTHSKGILAEEFTVADFVRPHGTFKNATNRSGIVHRLDRDTSGVMILAKNDETAAMLQKQFANRKVKKSYIAIVQGSLDHQEANLDLPIERNPKLPSQFRVGPSGKSAITHYKVLKQNGNLSLLELSPETGRTHQLRVHLSYINAPIVGDRIYGKEFDRLYLHAHKLEITVPGSKRKVFAAPLPEEFEKMMEKSE